jgi:citrate lyase acyl carrier protein
MIVMGGIEILDTGIAGTLESSDVMITIKKNNGIAIELNSVVEKQFGRQIREVVGQVLEQLGVRDALVVIQDKGALECVLRARLITAVYRSAGIAEIQWETLS